MLKIYIQGLRDGTREVTASSAVSDVPDIAEEFYGDVEFAGKLKVLGQRFYVDGVATCHAKFLCDISLEEFEEEISVAIKMAFHADNEMLRHGEKYSGREQREVIIAEDEKYLDLTDEIREELMVNLPMKRIAPRFRGKSIDDVYPEFTQADATEEKENNEIDERWSPLKKLKLN